MILACAYMLCYPCLLLYYILCYRHDTNRNIFSGWWKKSWPFFAVLCSAYMALMLLYGFVDGWDFWGEVVFATCWTLLIGNLAFTSYVFLQLGIVWLVVYNLLFTTVMSFAFRHEVIAAIALIPFLIICPVIAVKLQAKSRSKPAEQEAFH